MCLRRSELPERRSHANVASELGAYLARTHGGRAVGWAVGVVDEEEVRLSPASPRQARPVLSLREVGGSCKMGGHGSQ